MQRISYNFIERKSQNSLSSGNTHKIKFEDTNHENSRFSYKISKDGELLIKGDISIIGMWLNKKFIKSFEKDGWFHTGLLVKEDNEGYISIRGWVKALKITKTKKNNFNFNEIIIPITVLIFLLAILITGLMENLY